MCECFSVHFFFISVAFATPATEVAALVSVVGIVELAFEWKSISSCCIFNLKCKFCKFVFYSLFFCETTTHCLSKQTKNGKSFIIDFSLKLKFNHIMDKKELYTYKNIVVYLI